MLENKNNVDNVTAKKNSYRRLLGTILSLVSVGMLLPLFQNATQSELYNTSRTTTTNATSSSVTDNDLSEVCGDPSLSNQEKSRRGCCKDNNAIDASTSLKQYCEAFGEPIMNQTNVWTKSIWEKELERRKNDLNDDQEGCSDLNLSPEHIAKCSNMFDELNKEKNESVNNEDVFQKASDLYDDLTHPLNWIPGFSSISDNVSVGMGDPLRLTPPEVQESIVFVQVNWRW